MTPPVETSGPRSLFFGRIPESYRRLNTALLECASVPAPGPAIPDSERFHAAASTLGLDRVVKILPLPTAIPAGVSSGAIGGMENLRDLGLLTALRGARPTDLPRPEAGRLAGRVRSEAPELIILIKHIEHVLAGSHLFVRAVKLEHARTSTTAGSDDPTASNLHFDADRSSLTDYSDPISQFYLNAGRLERQFRILPVGRDAILAAVDESERHTLPLEEILKRFSNKEALILETIPIESGALAIFDGRRFAHDAGKSDVEALASGRLEPSAEPDLVVALDTVETGYHQGLYRPELPFFEDRG